jgi:hypothetical protein
MKAHCTLHCILLSGALLFSAFSSCKDSPVEPPRKDPRTYTWTIDTLAYPGSAQTMMQDIWGSSPENVFVVGHNDQNHGLMWRFDGRKWTDVKLSTLQGGSISGAMDLYAIFGFNASSIFAIGERIYDNPNPPPHFLDSSLVIHYDGNQWREHRVVGRFLQAIWGSSPADVWVCGVEGTLYYYNGQRWSKEVVPLSPPPNSYYKLYGIGGTSPTDIYLLASAHEDHLIRTTYYFLRRNATGWAVIDTFVNQAGVNRNKWGTARFWTSPWGVLYSVGAGAFQWNGSSWEKILTVDEPCTHIFGTPKENLFVVGFRSALFHYNGVDWYRYDEIKFPQVGFVSGWTDGKELFVVGGTLGAFPQKTLILRGR